MIVFDSSTLILSAKSQILDDFLNNYKGKVVIPMGVEEECCMKKQTFDALLIRKRIKEQRITVMSVIDDRLRAGLAKDFRLGRGESEGLALAVEKRAKLVATDDKNAIKAYRILRLKYTSAISILVKLCEKGIIDVERRGTVLSQLLRYGRYGDEIVGAVKRELKIA